jgi:hypothetical protein
MTTPRNGESYRLQHAEHETRQGHRQGRLAQHHGLPEMPGTAGDLREPLLLARHRPGFPLMDEQERYRCDEKRPSVHDRHGGATEHGEQAGPSQGADEAKAFTCGLEEAVGVDELILLEHRHKKGRLGRAEEGVDGPVQEHHEPDEPYLATAVNKEQSEHGDGSGKVCPDEQRAAADAIDDEPGKGRGERGEPEEEEREAGVAGAAGELLHPDTRSQPQRHVAEEREDLTAEVPPGVSVGEQTLHV